MSTESRSEKSISMSFEGLEIPAVPGQSVAAALLESGIRSWRKTRHHQQPRGLFCGIGVCYDCLITIDGALNQRACLAPAADGMVLSRDDRWINVDEKRISILDEGVE
ncbi:(2Fe-2S)-binding protein [Streptomyces arenae]|uniref:(2Fe-2S)-binding protein n=1 Tax=Streptomyces arenae TaxID=29301 RepID=UPI00265B0F40|nr:(2Fe-2S)-binding protein [Streptomyces arenae]MCG7207439.1 (2Fe-2S)-binding protein [Streptomyces arenae]